MKNESAFPSKITKKEMIDLYDGVVNNGLTKREYIACNIMQGICASDYTTEDNEWIAARWAVKAADALIEELNK